MTVLLFAFYTPLLKSPHDRLREIRSRTFRRQLMKYSDLELIKMGKACAPAEWLIADSMTKAEYAKKYELCRAE